jgi:Flp pilus assembly protein TadD
MSRIDSLQALLQRRPDDALLHYSLGMEQLKGGDSARARVALERATALAPEHTAAWKLLGKACAQTGALADAAAAYRKGIEVAERKGDVQAVKEMRVFLARIQRG